MDTNTIWSLSWIIINWVPRCMETTTVCCFPVQYEAFMLVTGGEAILMGEQVTSQFGYGYTNGSVQTAYDSINKRTYIHQDITSINSRYPGQPQQWNFIDIIHYEKRTRWRIYGDSSCEIYHDVMSPLWVECIPDLMRVWVAFFIVALTVFLVSYIFGLVLCCWRQSKWAYIAGLLAYIAAFFTAASIAFFHGAEYLERNKIKDVDPLTGKFWFTWEEDVKNATDRDYGYSYIIGWIGMALAAITATLYSVAGCFIGGERYKDEYGEKGRSRDYLERSYPMPLEAQPYYPKGYYQYGAGPYLYDMENRQPLPAITYGPPPGAYFQGY